MPADVSDVWQNVKKASIERFWYLYWSAQDTIEEYVDRSYSNSQAFGWTAPMVGAWLSIIGLGQYIDSFLENGVDGVTLLSLKKADYGRCLNIMNRYHKDALYEGLQLLKKETIQYNNWQWSCDAVETWLEKRNLGIVARAFKENAVHGGVLYSFSKRSLERFLSGLGGSHVGKISTLIFKSLWLSIKRAKKLNSAELNPSKYSQDWGSNELGEWLRRIDLYHLLEKFKRHGVNGTSLIRLNRHDLFYVLGVTKLQMNVLFRHIRALRKVVKNGGENAWELLDRTGPEISTGQRLSQDGYKECKVTKFDSDSSTCDSSSKMCDSLSED